MKALRMLAALFLLPGTLVLSSLNINVDDDGGVFRSLINMIFWGFVAVTGAIPLMLG